MGTINNVNKLLLSMELLEKNSLLDLLFANSVSVNMIGVVGMPCRNDGTCLTQNSYCDAKLCVCHDWYMAKDNLCREFLHVLNPS